MMRIQYCFIWISFWLTASTLRAQVQTNFVMLGAYRVHPTRILAKFNDTVTPQSSVVSLQSLGLKIHRSYRLVPGLVMLDEANAIRLTSLRAFDAETQRQRL